MSKKSRPRQQAANQLTAAQSSAVPNSIQEMAQHLPGTAPVAKRVMGVMSQHSHFEGPIPHPDIFRKYGDVIPNAPERILKVFEDDSKHAREIQFAALNAQKSDNHRVQWMAWSLIFGGFLLSAIFAFWNKDWLAGIILGSTLVGTIAGFFQNKKENKT